MSNLISSIYKSRRNILDLLTRQGYKTDDYLYFSINEIDAMYATNQMDMLVHRESDGSSIYVKYSLSGKKMSASSLDNIVQELFDETQLLTDKSKDTIILINDEVDNSSLQKKLKFMFDSQGYYMIVYGLNRLQYIVLDHVMVPSGTVMTEEAEAEMMKQYHITKKTELPQISRFDPLAMNLGLRPGQIVHLKRKSPTAVTYDYYRVCV